MAPHTKLSKERFLEELALGKSMNSIFKAYGYSGNGNFYAWCRLDPVFKKKAQEIRDQNPEDLKRRAAAARRFAKTSPGWQHKDHEVLSEEDIEAIDFPSWREKFLHRYSEVRDRFQAAKFCGKTLTEIRNALNPKHDDYDNEFTILWEEAELDEAWQVEDKMKQKAVHHGDMNAIKHLLPVLPVVGEKYKKQQDRSSGNVSIALFNITNRNSALLSIDTALADPSDLEEVEVLALSEPKASFVS